MPWRSRKRIWARKAIQHGRFSSAGWNHEEEASSRRYRGSVWSSRWERGDIRWILYTWSLRKDEEGKNNSNRAAIDLLPLRWNLPWGSSFATFEENKGQRRLVKQDRSMVVFDRTVYHMDVGDQLKKVCQDQVEYSVASWLRRNRSVWIFSRIVFSAENFFTLLSDDLIHNGAIQKMCERSEPERFLSQGFRNRICWTDETQLFVSDLSWRFLSEKLKEELPVFYTTRTRPVGSTFVFSNGVFN